MEMNSFDRHMMAITFAEAGDEKTARQVLGGAGGRSPAAAPQKRKPYGKMVVFGAVSLSAYLLLFTHQGWVTNLYTMGGWHTVFPVATALFFSFIHGAFASNLLSVLNLEAKKH